MPQPVINNEPVAPVLNTIPSQTRAHENHLLISMQQQLQQLEAAQQIQIMQQQQEIAAARHFGRLWKKNRENTKKIKIGLWKS